METFDCSSCGASLPDDSDILCAACSFLLSAEVLICTVGTCTSPAPSEHAPCCSSHGRALCCEHYCNTHFVQVSRCSPLSHAAANAAPVSTTED